MSTVLPISAYTIGQAGIAADKTTGGSAANVSTFADILLDAVEDPETEIIVNPDVEMQNPPGEETQTPPEAETGLPPGTETGLPPGAETLVPPPITGTPPPSASIEETETEPAVTDPGTIAPGTEATAQEPESKTNGHEEHLSQPDTGTCVNCLNLELPEEVNENSLQQAINTASNTNNNNDIMIALMMMMVMMASGSGDMSMMMPLMTALFDNMQQKEEVRNQFLMSSGGEPSVLVDIDEQVFGNNAAAVPETSGTPQAVLPLEWWKPVTPAIVNTQTERNPAYYRAVLDQFDVENAERYRPGREGHTYCNVYVWDATRAMGAEIPYYADPQDGSPREYPDIKGANYQGAKAMDRWLKTYGEQFGWQQVTAEQAQMAANRGQPTVASGGNTGHISMVAPSQDGSFDPVRGVTIAQAGRIVSNYMYISGVWGSSALNNEVTYWTNNW